MTQYFHEAHAHDANPAISLLAQEQYLREMRWIPAVSREEEACWLEQVIQGLGEGAQPDQLQLARDARDRLVETYQKVITGMAARFARNSPGNVMLDFINEGAIGLLHLLDRLDVYTDLTGAAFNALALAYIRGAMLDLSYNRDGIVRVPERAIRELKQVARVEEALFETLGREPTTGEIAAVLQLSVEKVLELIEYRRCRSIASLESYLEEDETADKCDFVSLFQAQLQADEGQQTRFAEVLHDAMNTALSERQREVVRTRYGFDEESPVVRSREDTASMLGVTCRTVDEHHCQAIRRLAGRLEHIVLRAAHSQDVA